MANSFTIGMSDEKEILIGKVTEERDLYKDLYEKADARQNNFFQLFQTLIQNKNERGDSINTIEKLLTKIRMLEEKLQKADDAKKTAQEFHLSLMRRFHNMMGEREEELKKCQEELYMTKNKNKIVYSTSTSEDEVD